MPGVHSMKELSPCDPRGDKGKGKGSNPLKDDAQGNEAKGKGKKKLAPEDRGFHQMDAALYVREPQLHIAMPVENCSSEIGTLEEKTSGLPMGHATLCNRQSLFGNPFSMLRAKGKCKDRGKPDTAENDEMRNLVCELFDDFLTDVLKPEAKDSLAAVADAVALKRNQPTGIVGKDWTRDFGWESCESFRRSFHALQELQHRHCGRLRFVCHCAPQRCHTISLARASSKNTFISGGYEQAKVQHCSLQAQARHQEEETHCRFQSANFPGLGQSQVENSSLLVQGETFSSPAEPSGPEVASQSASVALRQHCVQSEGSKTAAELKPEQLVPEMAATATRCRRWNRRTALPNDSKAEVNFALVDASSDGNKETVSAQLIASLHDYGFTNPRGKQPLDETSGPRSPVVTYKEVRRLLKALREIDELELTLKVVAEAGGHLRWNQMQKIAQKQQYLDKLHELAISASDSRGN